MRRGEVYRSQPVPGQARGEPAPEIRFEAGDVVVALGEPDSLAAAEIRLPQGMK